MAVALPGDAAFLASDRVVEQGRVGAVAFVNLADVYKGEDVAAIRLAEWDEHPNARGHRLMAAQLYESLQAKRDLVFRTSGR